MWVRPVVSRMIFSAGASKIRVYFIIPVRGMNLCGISKVLRRFFKSDRIPVSLP